MFDVSSLDNTGSKVSPLNKFGSKKLRFSLRETSAKLLPSWAVGKCGRSLGKVDIILKNTGSAYYGGVETCGSIWTCPICATKIAEKRRLEVNELVSKHVAEGNHVYMLTLTTKHGLFDTAKDLKQGIADSWRKCMSGSPWIRAQKRYRYVGYVRSLEVTYGKNGWHPHLHVLLLLKKLGEYEKREFEDWLFRRWKNKLESLGFAGASREAFKFERCDTPEQGAAYAVKFGTDYELCYSHMKEGKGGGKTPWQLLEDAKKGKKQACKLFTEYAEAFKGARQLTWSRGLRELYGLVEEQTDEEIAQEEEATDVCILSLSNRVYNAVKWRGHLADVLHAAEEGGKEAVIILLNKLGIEYDERTIEEFYSLGSSPPYRQDPWEIGESGRDFKEPCGGYDRF